jgi:hypothetical protein
MSIISMFYGLVIYMYFQDNKRHHTPHIHVKCQDSEAIFSIPDGEVISGDIPAKKIQLVKAWIILHEEDLMTDWDLAVTGQGIFRIEPLK